MIYGIVEDGVVVDVETGNEVIVPVKTVVVNSFRGTIANLGVIRREVP